MVLERLRETLRDQEIDALSLNLTQRNCKTVKLRSREIRREMIETLWKEPPALWKGTIIMTPRVEGAAPNDMSTLRISKDPMRMQPMLPTHAHVLCAARPYSLSRHLEMVRGKFLLRHDLL
jgi:hypothetical protein